MQCTFIVLTYLIYTVTSHVSSEEDSIFLTDEEAFEIYKHKYGKSYMNAYEEEKRKNIFSDNRKSIRIAKTKYDLGMISYQLKMNRFGDCRAEEFGQNFFGLLQPNLSSLRQFKANVTRKRRDVPDKLDYRDAGIVAPVKDQGQCGSCYAFATVAAIESQVAKLFGGLHTLSDQQAVDCSSNAVYLNQGCAGGYLETVFQYIHDIGGIDYDADYSYVSGVSKVAGVCAYNANIKSKAIVNSYVHVPANENSLLTFLIDNGPVSVGIDASQPGFQLYSSGVYYAPFCSSKVLNHAVLLIGYGTYNPLPLLPFLAKKYWLVKNQWGTGWGINGYMMMSRDRNNNCGIASYAVFPIVTLAP